MEDAWWYGATHAASRIALIAATYADARDTMVEGESGLLALLPEGCLTTWNRSLGELTLYNGTKYKLFAATEPDRLRGPQHIRAYCFIAGTMVATDAGERPIESIKIGDFVWTLAGKKAVTATTFRVKSVGTVVFSNGRSLTGTFDHPVWTANGWKQLGLLTEADDLCAIDVLNPVTIAANVVSTWRPVAETTVFCLRVEGERQFFANGLLVHNCDELAAWEKADTWDQMLFGLRLGQSPKVVIATTPRPVPLVRRIAADPHTIITRGSTFDNAANLAPSALAQLRAKYEGTRLGRQELAAEILDDIPGALWTRDMIDAARKPVSLPDMARIVVAIDPSGTRGESDNGDSIGIVVAGKGVDGRGYVLADRSCKLSPAGWGRRAVEAYHEFRADRIVAERNFGGAMVEHVIRTTDKTVSYAEVVASRGKVVRAEPVAALYEQGKVSHRGDLAVLEDQMCQLGPEGYLGDGSPDRLDAMVWALSYLVLDGRKDPLMITDAVLKRSSIGARR